MLCKFYSLYLNASVSQVVIVIMMPIQYSQIELGSFPHCIFVMYMPAFVSLSVCLSMLHPSMLGVFMVQRQPYLVWLS